MALYNVGNRFSRSSFGWILLCRCCRGRRRWFRATVSVHSGTLLRSLSPFPPCTICRCWIECSSLFCLSETEEWASECDTCHVTTHLYSASSERKLRSARRSKVAETAIVIGDTILREIRRNNTLRRKLVNHSHSYTWQTLLNHSEPCHH